MHVPFEWKTFLSPFLHCQFKTKMLGVDYFQFSPLHSCYYESSKPPAHRASIQALDFSDIKGLGLITVGDPGGFRI